MKHPLIVVFLKNKLISCDTILPLLYELSEKHAEIDIEFYCFDKLQTYDSIRRNVVIHNVINKIGKLYVFDTKRIGFIRKFLVNLRRGFALLRLIFLSLSGRVKYIHFGLLNHYKYRLLFKLNRKNTFLFEAGPHGFSKIHMTAGQWMYAHRNKKVRSHPEGRPAADLIVAYDKNWPLLETHTAANIENLIIMPPFRRAAWHNYLKENADEYLERAGLLGKDFIVYILSSMDSGSRLLVNPEDFPVLFEETLEILSKEVPDIPVIVKTHPATYPNLLNRQKQILARTPKKNIILADIHPLLLATQGAKAFICNVVSSTLIFAKELGVPTIEYSHYCPDILKITNGGSTRPDLVTYFCNRDEKQFRKCLKMAISHPKEEKSRETEDSNYNLLLERLAG